jgi:hypothetical protein
MWTVTLMRVTGPGVGFLQEEGSTPLPGSGVGPGAGVGPGVGAGFGVGVPGEGDGDGDGLGLGLDPGVGVGTGVTGRGVAPGSGTPTLGFDRVGSTSVRRVWLQLAKLTAASPKSTVLHMDEPPLESASYGLP